MTDLTEIPVSKILTDTAPRESGGSTRVINNRLSIFLIALIALSPVPLGSNRPFFWAVSSFLVAIAALIYGVSLWRAGSPFRYQLSRLGWMPVGFGVIGGWMALQALPIGTMFGGFELELPGATPVILPTLSIAPGETWLALIRFVGYGLFFFLMLQVSVNNQRARKMLLALAVIVVGHAIFAMTALTQLGDPLLFFEKSSYLGVATGSFVNRNSFATFLGMGAVVALALAIVHATDATGTQTQHRGNLLESRYLPAITYFVGWGVMVGTIFATQSRMGLFVAMVGSIVVTASTLPRGRKMKARGVIGILAALLVGGILLVALYGAGVTERLGSVDTASDVRLNLYRQVIELIGLRPFTGFGAGTFNLSFPLVHGPAVSVDLVWDKAHNTFLSLWSELGVIVGSLPVLIIATLGVMVARRMRLSDRVLPAPAAAFAAIVATGLHSFVDFSLEIHAIMYFLLALIAVGIAPSIKSKSDPVTKNTSSE